MHDIDNESYTTYEIEFKIYRELLSDDDYHEYIVDIFGTISQLVEGDSPTRAGTLTGHIVKVDRIWNDDERLFDICDAHSQTLHEYSCALFNFKKNELKQSIDKQFGGLIARDVLIIDQVQIFPQYRGKGLGLAAVWRFMDTFQGACGLAVMQPFPLQSNPLLAKEQKWFDEMGMSAFEKDEKLALEKLRSYWGRLGFERLLRTKYFALSLEQEQPGLKEVLAPFQRDNESQG